MINAKSVTMLKNNQRKGNDDVRTNCQQNDYVSIQEYQNTQQNKIDFHSHVYNNNMQIMLLTSL